MRTSLIIVLLMFWGMPVAQATIYKCEGVRGGVVFSDEPCGENPEIIDLSDDKPPEIRTERRPESRTAPPPAPRREALSAPSNPKNGQNPCLKDYHATHRGEVDPTQRGVTRAYIIEHCGTPDHIAKTDDPQTDEVLVYVGPETEVHLYMSEGKVLWRGRVSVGAP